MRPQQTEAILQFFEYAHLPPDLQDVSARFHDIAHAIVHGDKRFSGGIDPIQPCPERTVALRKLLEAKDAAVRAVLFKPATMPIDEAKVLEQGEKMKRKADIENFKIMAKMLDSVGDDMSVEQAKAIVELFRPLGKQHPATSFAVGDPPTIVTRQQARDMLELAMRTVVRPPAGRDARHSFDDGQMAAFDQAAPAPDVNTTTGPEMITIIDETTTLTPEQASAIAGMFARKSTGTTGSPELAKQLIPIVAATGCTQPVELPENPTMSHPMGNPIDVPWSEDEAQRFAESLMMGPAKTPDESK